MSSFRASGNAAEKFAGSPEQFQFAVDRVLLRFTHELARQMKADAPKAHSLLANSIKPDRLTPFSWRVGPHVAYAEDVEEGTAPGRFVDKTAIRDWIKVKGLAKGQSLKSATFLIARKIEQQGTDAQPFVSPLAVSRKWHQRLDDLMSKELNRALD